MDKQKLITFTSALSGVVLGTTAMITQLKAEEIKTHPSNSPIEQEFDTTEASQEVQDQYALEEESTETKNEKKSSFVSELDSNASLEEEGQEESIENNEDEIPNEEIQDLKIAGAGANQLLQDGDYTIQSAVDQKYVVDVSGGGKQNGQNIQIYENNDTAAQIWKVRYDQKDGTYSFWNAGSGKVLDVTGALIQSGTNIQQYEWNGTMAQKWILTPTTAGFKITSALHADYVLDLYGGYATNTSNLQLYKSNNTKAQRWNFLHYISKEETLKDLAIKNVKTLVDGDYTISNVTNNYVLSVENGQNKNGANVDLEKNYNFSSQVWRVNHDQNGFITFTNLGTGKVLDVLGAQTNNGNNVQLYSNNGTRAQKWVAIKSGNNYQIVSALDPYILLTNSNMNSTIYGSKGNHASQTWTFIKAESLRTRIDRLASKNKNTISDGYYTIHTNLDPNFVLDVSNASKENGANIQLYTSNNTFAQQFRVLNDNRGYVTIQNINSGKLLTAASAVKNMTNVIQNELNKSSYLDKWILIKNTNGTISIVSAENDAFVLDVTAALGMNGTNIQLYESNGTKAQQFTFKQVANDALWISTNNYLTISQMEHNATLVWNFFKNQGWTPNAVSAILGNMQAESNINPGLWEGREENNFDRGFGLVQWTPATNVINWLIERGYSITSGYGQCAKILDEYQYGGQYYATKEYPLNFYQFVNSKETPEYLALAFLNNYERPYNRNQPQRSVYARNWYNFITKL